MKITHIHKFHYKEKGFSNCSWCAEIPTIGPTFPQCIVPNDAHLRNTIGIQHVSEAHMQRNVYVSALQKLAKSASAKCEYLNTWSEWKDADNIVCVCLCVSLLQKRDIGYSFYSLYT